MPAQEGDAVAGNILRLATALVNARRWPPVVWWVRALFVSAYLFVALVGPIVQWSDSAIDLTWARVGAGILTSAQAGGHAAKPGYLAFLWVLLHLATSGHALRTIVVCQSVAVAGAGTLLAWRIGLCYGRRAELAVLAVLICFTRVRDAASSIMPEALAIALLFLVFAVVVSVPRRCSAYAATGALTCVLGLVRPNVGAVAVALVIVVLLARRAIPALLCFLLVICVLAGVTLFARQGGRDTGSLGGLSFTLLESTGEYYWVPSLGNLPRQSTLRDTGRAELAVASRRWKDFLRGEGYDWRRELAWRGLYGILGTEYYDARWSALYRLVTHAGRMATPYLLLASIATGLSCSRSGTLPIPALVTVLLGLLVAQDYVLGSNPRFILPFLPVLLVLGVLGMFELHSYARRGAAVAIFALGVLAVTVCPGLLSWQWGQVERAGVVITQALPRGSLPAGGTLHLRIATPVLPSGTGVHVFLAGILVYDSSHDPERWRPDLRIPVPPASAAESARGPVLLRVQSYGAFDQSGYLMFPVVPLPWASARRGDQRSLSPQTGLARGGLEWWSHTQVP